MYITKLDDINENSEVGFKSVSLSKLKKDGLPVQGGFVISPEALDVFLTRNVLRGKIDEIISSHDRSPAGMNSALEKLREVFVNAFVPEEIRKEIAAAYADLSVSGDVRAAEAALSIIKAGRNHELVAVRSSVMRDPHNSFAGVLDSFLNVNGEEDLIRHVKLCWASMFFPHAKYYREKQGVENTKLPVLIQKMATSEKSGVIMTGFGGDKILIEASWGLGSAVTSGIVTPDEYLLDAAGNLIEKNISKKMWMLERNDMTGQTVKVHVPGSRMDAQVVSETEMKKLYEIAVKVSSSGGHHLIDWTIGRNRIFINDIKPGSYEIARSEEHATGDVIVTGRFVSKGSVSGTVRHAEDGPLSPFGVDNVAVFRDSDPKKLLSVSDAGAAVTDDGSRLCNFGILARELGIPALTATQNASQILKEGDSVKLIAEQGKVLSVQQEPLHEEPATGESAPATDFSQFSVMEQSQEDPFAPPVPAEPARPQEPSEPPETFPMPFEDPQSQNENPLQTEKPIEAEKKDVLVFAKTGPEMIGRVDGADGTLVCQVQAQPDMMVSQAEGPAGNIWISPNNEQSMQWASDISRRLLESGTQDTGILLPVVKGEEDISRMRYQLPAGCGFGVSLKTPAMAFHAEKTVTNETGFVNIELDPLIQLSMGLKEPEQNIHPSVIGMINDVRKRCEATSTRCAVTLGQKYITDWNIEMIVKQGVDALCVEPEMVDHVKGILSRIQPVSENVSESTTENAETIQDSTLPLDFTSPFSS